MRLTVSLFLAAGTAASAELCLTPGAACAETVEVGGKSVLFYRTHSLTSGSHTAVDQAIVMVHGARRNGDEYFGTVLAAAAAAGRLGQAVLVAPRFKAIADGCKDTLAEGEFGWSCEGWKTGEAAANGSVTSFDAMDRVMALLNDAQRFPRLREIVVAGHSAGGQFVQRYAAASMAESRLPVRYAVANPSSYVYLNELRMDRQATCSEKGGCTAKFVPYWDAENCTTFNRYKHGLEGLTGYAAKAGADRMRAQLPVRDVTYLLGELDVNQDSDLESTCNAFAQGRNRRDRGQIYWNYIRQQFGAKHGVVVVPGCGHSATCMYASKAGYAVLFGPAAAVR